MKKFWDKLFKKPEFLDYSYEEANKKRRDESGMFEDFNFKLVVMDSILDQNPSFLPELQRLREKYDNLNDDFYKPFKTEEFDERCFIPPIAEFLQKVRLTDEDLAKVEKLYFDGGNEIYEFIYQDWQGEDEIFEVYSVVGFEKLPNLKKVFWSGICEQEVLEVFKENGIEVDD